MCLSNEVCRLSLLARRSDPTENIIGICTEVNNVHAAAGLNWGYTSGMPTLEDAYISVSRENILQCQDLFVKRMPKNVIWDDNVNMTLLAEQNYITVNSIEYGKALSTLGNKSFLGHYLRTRIGTCIGKELNYTPYAINTLRIIKQNCRGNKDDIVYEINRNQRLLEELRDKFITTDDLMRYGRTDISVSFVDGIYRFDFSV